MNSILVVEDQPAIRRWIIDFTSAIFTAASFREAATLEQARTLLTPLPDLLLLDLRLPDGRGDSLIPDVKRVDPAVPCVIVSAFDDDALLFSALQAGADGYLLKDQNADQLQALLQGILDGRPPLSPAIAQRLIHYFHRNLTAPDDGPLTEREKETLRLIGKGYSVKECAQYLSISPHTVAGYIKNIYRKLNIDSRAEAASKARDLGLL